MTDRRVVVVSAKRTPIGKFGGTLRPLSAADLGQAAARAAVDAVGLEPSEISEVIFGHGRQAGGRPNTARQISWGIGCGPTVPAFTVNKACASSLKTITLGAASILAGENDIVLAGGTESMSNTPYMLLDARWGERMGPAEVVDGMYHDGFLCPLCGELMGATAENLADKHGIDRAEQDRWAVETQRRAGAAIEAGRFVDEIVPVEVPRRKGDPIRLEADEHPRPDATVEKMAKLKAVFRKDGTVHAGNASGVTDGAAAVVLMTEAEAERRALEPLAAVEAWAYAGVPPEVMGLGPVPAIRKLEEKASWKLAGDVGLVELNEAFAAQILACARELPELDLERTNVNGGAIALGHPIGATGARIVTTLLHEMKRRDVKRGLATLCVSGGLGAAVSFVRP